MSQPEVGFHFFNGNRLKPSNLTNVLSDITHRFRLNFWFGSNGEIIKSLSVARSRFTLSKECFTFSRITLLSYLVVRIWASSHFLKSQNQLFFLLDNNALKMIGGRRFFTVFFKRCFKNRSSWKYYKFETMSVYESCSVFTELLSHLTFPETNTRLLLKADVETISGLIISKSYISNIYLNP